MDKKDELKQQTNTTSKGKQGNKNQKLHYQVYLSEDRPRQPKEEDEIEY